MMNVLKSFEIIFLESASATEYEKQDSPDNIPPDKEEEEIDEFQLVLESHEYEGTTCLLNLLSIRKHVFYNLRL